MGDSIDLSFIKDILTDASKGYVYQKYGYASNNGNAYFKGQDGGTYTAGQPAQPATNATVTNYVPLLIVGAVVLGLVLVMD